MNQKIKAYASLRKNGEIKQHLVLESLAIWKDKDYIVSRGEVPVEVIITYKVKTNDKN